MSKSERKTSRTCLSNVFKFKVKVIETSMNLYAIHKSTVVLSFESHRLISVRDIAIKQVIRNCQI